jgi:hypothetical protein
MFNTYVDTLIQELNSLNLGIKFGPELISVLMYADDLCLIAENEADLQIMLNTVAEWSRKWRLSVNVSKTCVIHFRSQSIPRTNVQFTYQGYDIEVVTHTRYLGLTFNEHMDYSIMANVLAESSSRALGALISKVYKAKGFQFKTYEHIFKCTVQPVMEYAAEIWGYKHYGRLETVMHRAIKTFMGVGKTCPTPVILGDTGWLPSQVTRKVKMVAWWNKLQQMDTTRLTRNIFEHDLALAQNGKNTWAKDIKGILCECGLENNFCLNNQPVGIQTVQKKLKEAFISKWTREVASMSKLTHYAMIKDNFGLEEYVTAKYLTHKQRGILVSTRAGTLPIETE